MQTRLAAKYANTEKGLTAESIIRNCVHCGFCNATCPTYQLLGDERDGPRGRIYLIKQVFEGVSPTRETQVHLDQCLTCRACESTCPSGVEFAKLADIGRMEVDTLVNRPFVDRLIRKLLLQTVPYPATFRPLLKTANLFKPLLPQSVKARLIPVQKTRPLIQQTHQRFMLVLAGCVQSVSSPNTNQAAANVLDKLQISLLEAPKAGCCGALAQHLSAEEKASNQMKQNIDAWWPFIEHGCEAIVMTASGCGSTVKDYGYLLRNDKVYAEKAAKVSELSKDIAEVIAAEDLSVWQNLGVGSTIAFQSPCSLQHGQQLTGLVETILQQLGFTTPVINDAHICCGSAGSYSLLQPKLSQSLRLQKLSALEASQPDKIVTANIGCQLYLSTPSRPVNHWIEMLAERIEHG
ncbi:MULTISPECIES: glycolate oxidase subunit GlcF [unclassified Methylophaga]|jgi:glycolate oxidase iron-sulfur subunit|uniref:glycolate oxidase subunit GlcF n=1 Tax=unclassified Methylophaga TaxID=2629249 RepID=UPI000C92C85B|nr:MULTISPECIES: glycolate oxidase subunit GlcF [unclassified Methylophaga]MAK66909.1 glycolate oxidase iron-sulfur subunit [Methylophaga sp.]MAY17945.1 glycolate oxidase iron-sulfur subunit [Methylophaga sp.]MBN47155.1 glycolate oxidase iron-sulfur subunit [Methylophaga sp.]HAO25162.1 glycolate oxidase iron-sulfur subunit [Methylophaga sp.]|tara:strand:+ start:5791 stop:7011 length:1221 start_codon:yes stop_codon:yes gene_type:complete